ncbi:MAG TPA: polyribonucleotide nucleotidyltransferase [Balneola sp.]|jgi:polyribonucleotide nucleotidyltransferase|nr:polyribonucleotide nucleotidyltransferase [Balneola sp.]MAO77660.1 polyribonucleotide nucleotidyltransferase [Balneola sp.]MBF64002.1 polyribonucleotide nucleotidyltransferase [Balneola sp.]HBZ38370.1 polyribonucleotide nucleotidyltransferase [Balneola sp.]|tara:strand:- start:255 stop:2366 length:2112 start_codon:yes stop_codon:yes gene_type:complete
MKEDFRSIEFAPGKVLSVETGRIAKQADGSVVVKMGDTMVLCTAVSAKEPKPGQDFFPLTVDHKESFSAAGRFPGGFMKREGRSNEKEILSSRLIDRVLRPLFPKGYVCDTQVISSVISSDDEHDGDVLGGVGASLAVHLSDIPFDGPMAEVRVGRVDGEFIINPTVNELKDSDIDMIVGGTEDSILMIEGEMEEISEAEMLDAIKAAHVAIKKLCDFQNELRKELGKEKREFVSPTLPEDVESKVSELASEKIKEIVNIGLGKEEYNAKIREVKDEVMEALESEEYDDDQLSVAKKVLGNIEKEELRNMILEKGRRIDGRATDEIRDIWTQVGYMPRTHGSAIFTRGETQALVSATLGTRRDEQSVDTLFDQEAKQFYLHYSFPPYSVGEAGFLRGPGRREIGHGHLAERSLRMMMPTFEEFGYVIRIISDITESNGSSSMASVCGGSMALMDAGVPIKKPVAGIAMGMIVGKDNTAILSDIRGEEDFMGDMDFKTAGTSDGITACQMDMKVQGISFETIEEALEQAHKGRMHILGEMAKTISSPRENISQYAPQFLRMEIDGSDIGAVIGPGGKVIQTLQKETGTEIIIEEDSNGKGQITISANDLDKAEEAKKRIKMIVGHLEEGATYKGVVKSIKDFGAFVEVAPGKDGLLHISEIDHKRVEKVTDYLQLGDEIEVKLLKVEHGGKLRLSRKALIEKED